MLATVVTLRTGSAVPPVCMRSVLLAAYPDPRLAFVPRGSVWEAVTVASSVVIESMLISAPDWAVLILALSPTAYPLPDPCEFGTPAAATSACVLTSLTTEPKVMVVPLAVMVFPAV